MHGHEAAEEKQMVLVPAGAAAFLVVFPVESPVGEQRDAVPAWPGIAPAPPRTRGCGAVFLSDQTLRLRTAHTTVCTAAAGLTHRAETGHLGANLGACIRRHTASGQV